MPSAFECPVEDCDYTAPSKASVGGHYQGMQDGLHPGGMQKAISLLEQGASQKQAESQDKQADKEAENTASNEAGSNPTFGAADPVQEPEPQTEPSEQPSEQATQDTDEQADPDDYVCLDCGGELVDFRQHERGSYAEVSNGNILVRGEWLCSDCGKWWFDE